MRKKLKNTALTCDSFGISDRTEASCVSSMLKDVGIVNNENTHIVDEYEIKRGKKLNAENSQTDLRRTQLPSRTLFL